MGLVRHDVTVIIPAYTETRWGLTCDAIQSVLDQTVRPAEIIVCIDHNEALYNRFVSRWHYHSDSLPRVTVIQSAYPGHVSASRTTALERAATDYVVYLDDDARADRDWLQRMLHALERSGVVAVGGAPIPVYGAPRPAWLPEEFNWIFGCAYAGLPERATPLRRVIGTTFGARRADLLGVGGFAFDVFEDLDISHKLLNRYPGQVIVYEPAATVRHYVSRERLTWQYFVRRVFWVNRGKVKVMRGLGPAANLKADREFVVRALTRGLLAGMWKFVRGDIGALHRAVATVIGIGIAGMGYLVGTFEWHARRICQARTADSGPEHPAS